MIQNPRNYEIQEIASDTGFPEEEVKRIYEDALQDLAAKARIKDYLHVLVSKRVRQHLKETRNIGQGDSSFLE